MKYIPEIHSFTDFLLWPLRLLFNLPIHFQAILGLALTAPLVLIVLFQKEGKRAEMELKMEQNGYIVTGMLDSNIDSVRVRRGETIRLLAQQGSLFWAETVNGRNRGFIRSSAITENPDSLGLPERRKLSSYYISREKFEELMSDKETTFESIEKEYISAEYIHPSQKGLKAEFGFYIVEPDAKQSRPIITFGSDNKIVEYTIVPFRSKKGLEGFENVEFMAPLISTGEIDQFDPFSKTWSNLIWTYLIGYLPLFLFMLILWMRYPLYWMPNAIANFISYSLAIVGPTFWCSILMVKGVSFWPAVPVTAIMVLAGLLFFWVFNSGLRCPKCKVLQSHEYLKSLKGEPFVRLSHDSREVGRENISRRNNGNWEHHYIKDSSGNSTGKTGVLKVHFKDRVHYEDYEIKQTVRMETKCFVCPKCGHGSQEKDEEILHSESKLIGRHSEIVEYDKYQIEGRGSQLFDLY